MIDFTIFYKEILEKGDWHKLPEYELFISTYDRSDRVNHIFSNIKAKEKHWLITPHHKLLEEDMPIEGTIYTYNIYNDDDYILAYFNDIRDLIQNKPLLCIDITGFIRPFIVFLFRYLASIGYDKIDVIYGEPIKYIHSEETQFSGYVDIVKTVPGCASNDSLPTSENDVLIIGAGYDDKLITAVVNNKKYCNMRYQIFGFPSLQPDMYQENVIKVHNAKESLGNEVLTLFAPAFDPFVTAQILKETIDGYLTKNQANFYLSPLSTKPQVLGFILYYLYEGMEKPINIIFPYSKHYSTNTCVGINKAWRYTVELPRIA